MYVLTTRNTLNSFSHIVNETQKKMNPCKFTSKRGGIVQIMAILMSYLCMQEIIYFIHLALNHNKVIRLTTVHKSLVSWSLCCILNVNKGKIQINRKVQNEENYFQQR